MRLRTIFLILSIILVLGIIFFALKGAPDVPADLEYVPLDSYSQAEAELPLIQSDTKAQPYEHPSYGFSFMKPEGYSVGSFVEGEGQVLLVQSADNNVKNDFQIYINPLTEEVKLTPTFIKGDLPGTTVGNPKEILLDAKASGIMFDSNNPGFDGKSYEIWFIYEGRIYQATSYSEFGSQLQAIIGTWKFN